MSEPPFMPAYQIETARLLVRCWEPADAAGMKAAIDSSLDYLRAWMPWAWDEPQELARKVQLTRHFRSRFDSDQDYVYGIFSRASGDVLGGTGLHARIGEGALEIGYWIRENAAGQGYATEASAGLTAVAFRVHHVHRVEIHCEPANVRSSAVPRKLGFTLECVRRQNYFTGREDPWRDTQIWTLLEDEFPSSPAAAAAYKAYDAAGNLLPG